MATKDTSESRGEEPDCRYSSYAGPRRLLHWGPLIAICIILWITIFTVFCDLMYWPVDTKGGILNLGTFLTWVSECTMNGSGSDRHFVNLSQDSSFVNKVAKQ